MLGVGEALVDVEAVVELGSIGKLKIAAILLLGAISPCNARYSSKSFVKQYTD
jgi:hypothetical protein